jgi:ParB family chromosome partitioning protein
MNAKTLTSKKMGQGAPAAVAAKKTPMKTKAAGSNAFAGAGLMLGAGGAMGTGIDALFGDAEMPEFAVNLDDVEIIGQVREEFENDEQGLSELGASLAKMQIQAIFLRVMPAGHPKPFRLVAGERRVRAARLQGLATLRAKAKELTDEEAEDLQFAENTHRKNLTQIEEARKIQRDLDTLGSVEAVLERHNKGRPWLSKMLSLLHLPEQAKRLVNESISADAEVISTVRQVEKVNPAKAKELVDDLKKTRGKEDARAKALAVRDEVKPKAPKAGKKGAEKGAEKGANTTVAQKDMRTRDMLASGSSGVDVPSLLVDIYERLAVEGQRPEEVLSDLQPEEQSACIAALRTPFEQARKAENAGKHVFAGLREGRFATEGAGALLLAACMCGLEGSFNSEFRLDDVLSVIV